MWIFWPYMNLYSKTSWKFYRQLSKTKLKFQGKWASSGFSHKESYVLLTVHKLCEHYYWQNWLKFYDKMDLSIRMRVMRIVKHRYAIRLKFGGKFLTSLTKLLLEAKAGICSTIKENLLLYCRKFSAFVIVVII